MKGIILQIMHPDQNLLNRIYQKDAKATREIIRPFRTLLKSFLRKQGSRDKQLVDDLMIETLVIIYQKEKTPQIDVKLVSYLMGIANNLYRARKARQREYPTEKRIFENLTSEDYIYELVELDEGRRVLNQLMQHLSERCRQLLKMILLEIDTEDICYKLNYRSKSMVYKKKSICLDRLRELGRSSQECFDHYYID